MAALALFVSIKLFSGVLGDTTTQEITYDQFIKMIENGKVAEVEFESDRIVIVPKNPAYAGRIFEFYTGRVYDPELTQKLLDAGVTFKEEIPDTTSAVILNVILTFVPIILLLVLPFFMFRKMSKNGGGMMGVGKSKAKVYVQKETGVTFKDVAGQEEAKESLQEVVDFLENPGKYTKIGAKLPKGALLWTTLLEQERLCSQRQLPGKLMCRFFHCQVLTL